MLKSAVLLASFSAGIKLLDSVKIFTSKWLFRTYTKYFLICLIGSLQDLIFKFCWFLAISSGKGGLDGWRMMATDDTGTDLWTVAGAWEELEGGGVAV